MSFPTLSSLSPQAIHEIAVQAKTDLCRSERTLAECLLEMERRRLYFDFGVSCVLDYAELILGLAAHTAREILRMARALGDLPKLADAYYGGHVSASKMREITRVAVPETEDSWLEKAACHNVRQIEMMVARTSKGEQPGRLRPNDKRPRPVRTRVRLDLTPEQMAIVLEAADLVTKIAGEPVPLNEAIELMAQDFLSTAHREEDARNRYRLVIHCDPAEKLAWVNTRRGPLRVSDETVSQALCDAEILDVRERKQPIERDHDSDSPERGDEPGEKPTSDLDVSGDASDGSTLSSDEDAVVRPTWDVPVDAPPPSDQGGSVPAERDSADESAPSPANGERSRPTWDDPGDEGSPEDEPEPWELLEQVAAGARTRDGAARLSRTVPPAVARHVLARDQYCCSVPGCTRRIWKEIHHIKWRVDGGNHDIDNLTALCNPHHKMIHDGTLSVSGTPSTGLMWKDAHGRVLQGSLGALREPVHR